MLKLFRRNVTKSPKSDADKTVEEMADEFIVYFERESKENQEKFKRCPEQQLGLYHHTLGRSIRNYFNMWNRKWEPHIIDDVDYSPNHPDAISMDVIVLMHRKLNNK